MKIGIISDTHGLLRPEAVERLASVLHIVHAGDIGHPKVISELRKIAPTTAIRGNIDRGEWASEYPRTALVKLGRRSIYVLHNLKELDCDLTGEVLRPSLREIDAMPHGDKPRFTGSRKGARSRSE